MAPVIVAQYYVSFSHVATIYAQLECNVQGKTLSKYHKFASFKTIHKFNKKAILCPCLPFPFYKLLLKSKQRKQIMTFCTICRFRLANRTDPHLWRLTNIRWYILLQHKARVFTIHLVDLTNGPWYLVVFNTTESFARFEVTLSTAIEGK